MVKIVSKKDLAMERARTQLLEAQQLLKKTEEKVIAEFEAKNAAAGNLAEKNTLLLQQRFFDSLHANKVAKKAEREKQAKAVPLMKTREEEAKVKTDRCGCAIS